MNEWLDFDDFADDVHELIDLGLIDEARDKLNKNAPSFSHEWELHYLYYRIAIELNEPTQALEHLSTGLRLDKTNLDILLGLFYVYVHIDDLKKGSRFLLLAEKFHASNEMVIAALIWYYTEIGKFSIAIAYFETIVHQPPVNPETFRNAALAYERVGDLERMEQYLRQAIILNPHFDEARDMLADQRILSGDLDGSVKLYLDYLIVSPKNVKTLSRLVYCYSQFDKLDKAIEVAGQIIALYPNSPVGYVDMAYIYLNEEDYEKSLASAEQALDIAPIDSEALRVKAIIYSETGDTTLAGETFSKALELDPDNPEILRDYYHHLRDINDVPAMLSVIEHVIEIEKPFCTEDYWFLADYYHEIGKHTKAFGYLHRVYKSMPGETEIIPPMVDILLDKNHAGLAMPFLIRYVEKSGWNETMNHLARNKRLRGKWAQETVRFLRFSGQRSPDFKRYIFAMYFTRFLLLFSACALPLFLLLAALFGGWHIAGILMAAYGAIVGGWYGITLFLRRKKQLQKEAEFGGSFEPFVKKTPTVRIPNP